MKEKITVYWSRKDFRLHDNPALFAAAAHSKKESIPLLPLFILEDYMVKGDPKEQFGYPSRFFLSKALPAFAKNFKNFTVFQGKAAETIKKLSEQFDLTIFVNEDVYIDFYTQIKKIRDSKIEIKLFADALTISKDTKTGAGNLYSIFTPFKNAVWSEFCNAKVLPKVNLSNVNQPTYDFGKIKKMVVENTEENLKHLFSPKRNFQVNNTVYDINLLLTTTAEYSLWYFDEKGALAQFDSFLKKIFDYKKERDYLDTEATSRMSLALSWGLISARILKEKIQTYCDFDFLHTSTNPKLEGPAHYLSELIWREFYKYLLFHKPELMYTEFQEKFRNKVTWVEENEAKRRFEKWMQGKTGYPIVDAAMMELAKTGYMHNRVRMIVASVLTKNFGVDWRWGQEYFRAMLIDIDEASNNGGWQWGASVGADPKPIRIFNPYLQADNYDKQGLYQKKFLPEEYFSNPPIVIVEHKQARGEALNRYGLSEAKHGTARDY